MLLEIFLKSSNLYSVRMNSRNNGPVLLFETINIFFLLGIETVSCCLLQQMARMQMDQNCFQVLMLCLQNTPKKMMMVIVP